MDKNFNKSFIICPACGSPDRFLEQLSQELKDRKLASPDWNMRYDARQGIVIDQQKSALLPIGISLPGYRIATDICMNCGCVYAVEITRIEGRTQATPHPQGKMPNLFNQIGLS